MTDLQSRLAEIARTPILLVGCDFDGTLAPIVLDPGAASADAATLGALWKLHEIPGTRLAVISGRSLEDLRALVGDTPEILLVGGHGVEWETGLSATMASGERELLARIGEALDQIVAGIPGSAVERKKAGVALHYRRSTTEDGLRAVQAALSGPGTWPGVHVRPGTMVLELGVVHASKGKALQTLRERVGATAVLFVGDDETDEEAFATLRAPDLGVKVGPGSTVAEHRIGSPAEVAAMLSQLAGLRRNAARPAPAVPIADHALLSDQRTVALVTPRGRISWLCLPRIDSSALMADLVGGPDAGYFDLTAQATGRSPVQSYEGDSFVLKTDWGDLIVYDYLDCSTGRPFQRAGRSDLIRVVEGEGPFRVVFSPRLDFGRVATRLVVTPTGIDVEGAVDPMVLHAPGLRWRILDDGRHQTAIAAARVTPGKPVVLEFRYGTRNLKPAVIPEPDRRVQTVRFWSAWAGALKLPSVQTALVKRSALAIRALCYGPSGAVAAAATTSLPEAVGGSRNWDYRFCWPRDAALAAAALVRLGNTGVALRLTDWLLGVLETLESPDRLRPVYTVGGDGAGGRGGNRRAAWVRREQAGARGQRRLAADPAGCLRAHRRPGRVDGVVRGPAHTGALAPGPGHGRGRRVPVARAGPRDLGAARGAAASRAHQGHVLADHGPRHRRRGPADGPRAPGVDRAA
jgi:trehalose-phosphatase